MVHRQSCLPGRAGQVVIKVAKMSQFEMSVYRAPVADGQVLQLPLVRPALIEDRGLS